MTLPKEYFEGLYIGDKRPFREAEETGSDLRALPMVSGFKMGLRRFVDDGEESWRLFLRMDQLDYDIMLDGTYHNYDQAILALHVRSENFIKSREEQKSG